MDNQITKSTITVAELADRLGVSLPTAYELANQSDFPSFRIGRKLLISAVGVENWIDDQIRWGKHTNDED